MKKFINLIFLYFPALILSCTTPQTRFIQDFDHGSLGAMEEIHPNYFKGKTEHWIKRDSIGDQYYWFYFKASQAAGKTLTFELNDLMGVYRGNTHLVYTDYTQPVFSYDQENWERIPDVAYDSATHTFIFKQAFEKEPVWIAYAHPYPYGRLEKILQKVRGHPDAKQESLAQTAEGRGIELITITDPDRPDADKKTIFLMAVQHAGEDAGAYLLEGLIDFLLSEDPGAQQVRENFIFKIIPMMNPDGIFNGITRYNTAMEDLNNIWLDEKKAQPEVTGVKNWVKHWYANGNTIDLFIDVHNHTQFHTYHAFIFQDHSIDSLVTVMNRYWPIRIWHSEFEGSSCAWFYQKGIPSGTIELSQGRINEGPYLTIDDYLEYGKGTAKGITEYFNDL